MGFQKQAAIQAGQRPFAPNKATSGTTFPATIFLNDTTYPADGSTHTYTPFAGPAGCTGPGLVPSDAQTCGENTNTFVDYIPQTERLSGILSASFKVNQNNTFKLEAFVAQSKVNAKIAPVPYYPIYMDPSSAYYPGKGITPLPTGYTLGADQVGATDADGNPITVNNGRILTRFRDLINGYREDDNTTTQGRFMASMEGTVGDWDYDVAATLNTTRTQDYLAHGYSNENVLATQDTDANSATYGFYVLNPIINPFGAQSAAGEALITSAAKQGVLQYGTGTVKDVDGHASRDLGDWFHAGRPAAIAIGGEYRNERFLQQANSEYAAQVVASTGIDPNTYNAGKREVYAAYSELNLPVLKSLDVTAAVRYDHYSDFGSTTNPKFSFRFQPVKAVLLRGSFSTGFRAPSLYELNAAQTYTNSESGVSDPVNCPDGKTALNGKPTQLVCSSPTQLQFVVRLGGNTGLKAEKAKNATLGLVLEPVNNLTTEFDLYSIIITKEVGTLTDDLLYTPAGYAQFPGNFHYNSQGLLSQGPQQCPGPQCGFVDELNQNLGAVRTNGVDIAVGYKMNAGSIGRFNFELQSTWVHSYKYELVPGQGYSEAVGVFSAGLGQPIFKWQHNLNVDWNLDPFALGLAVHDKSSYQDANSIGKDANGDPIYRRVSNYATEDLYASYSMAKGFSFTVGVKNLADRNPPYSNYTALFQQGYDPRFTDPTGRTYYGRMTYSF